MENRLKNGSIRISFLYGLPSGIVVTLLTFLTPVILTGEGILTMTLMTIYGKSILGLLISFILALYLGAIAIHRDVLNDKKLIWISFKYSLIINVIIWTTFTITTIVDNLETEEWLVMLLPIPIAFYICVILAPFTIGLLIAYQIKKFKQSMMPAKSE